jgi:hypothetical protein
MLPLVKKGMTVEFTISNEPLTARVFQSNPKCVWVETESGRIMKLHKIKHKIKVVEDLVEEKEETSGGKTLNDLYELKSKDHAAP